MEDRDPWGGGGEEKCRFPSRGRRCTVPWAVERMVGVRRRRNGGIGDLVVKLGIVEHLAVWLLHRPLFYLVSSARTCLIGSLWLAMRMQGE